MRRVFVANRGEVAVRIVRACHALGLQAVVGHSLADADSLAVRMADSAICVGPAPASRSYLDRAAVLSAAVATGCDAVHPGYGFLAEDPDFAEGVVSAGLVFVGPPPHVVRLMGDKTAAKGMASQAGLPVLESGPATEDRSAINLAGLRFPVLIKAAAGGGGRGIRRVGTAEDFSAAFHEATAEALAAFGDGRVYVETLVTRARHVEVQVLADHHGTVVHLGDRECSVQRRHQKVLEEAPAPVPNEVHERLGRWAVDLCKHVGYRNAGTVEFLYDDATGECWFIEMNPRLQVEHGVTELVTGIDIVANQLAIATGAELEFDQVDVTERGHAVEWRITCEDPERGFLPSPGVVTEWRAALIERSRVDSHCFDGYVVPPFYDSLLAKVMAHGSDRTEAIARLDRALAGLRLEGVATNRGLGRRILAAEEFRSAAVHTRWLDDLMKDAS